jgi:hypothetical protein
MAKHSSKTPTPKEATAQVTLNVQSDTPSYYVNYLGVAHTAYDITLSACKVPSPLTMEQAELVKNGKPIPIEPLVQLVISPLLVDGLIKALTDQKERHQQTLAQQVKNNENQQHIKPSSPVQ